MYKKLAKITHCEQIRGRDYFFRSYIRIHPIRERKQAVREPKMMSSTTFANDECG